MNGTTYEELGFWESLWGIPEMYYIWAGIAFIFGLGLGSFLNVCIYRVPAGLSVNRPKRSFCFRCGSMIQWFDNIPVLSYFLLRGRCRACGATFSPRYAAVELLTGLLFLAVFLAANRPDSPVFHVGTLWYLAFVSLLIVGSFTDFDTWIIPDGVTIGGTIAAIAASVVIGLFDPMPVLAHFGPFPVLREEWGDDGFTLLMSLMSGPQKLGYTAGQVLWWEAPLNAVMGAVFGAGLLWGVALFGKFVFRKDAMGFGDVKLFALIGATLGVMGSLLTLFVACVLGATAGLLGMLAGVVWKSDEASILQTGPRRLDGEETAAGETADDPAAKLAGIAKHIPRGRQVHHLPFGPWIAAGAVIVLVFHVEIHDWLRKVMF